MLEYWSIGIMGLEEFYLLKNDSFRFDYPVFHHSTIPLFQMSGLFRGDRKHFNLRWL
jgi:hypothetical protein